ncbi:MAG: hypothetical protein AAF790_01025 [Planctomycetota bacterium]
MTGLLAQAVTNLPNAEAAAAAPDTAWRLETSWRYAPWLTVVAVAAMAGVVAWCYAKELSPAGRGYRLLLGGLRLTTIALLLAMLSEMLLAGTRSGRPRFAVLIDNSASMGVEHTAELPGAPPRLQRANEAGATRLAMAQAALAEDAAGVLPRLAKGYDVRLYSVSDRLRPLDAAAGTEPATQGSADAGAADVISADPVAGVAVDASATGTQLGDALAALLGDATGPPQGVLLLTDGRVTRGGSLGTAAETARRVATPLYLVGVGSDRSPPDVELADLLAEDVVFVDDLASFRATLRTTAAVTEPVRVTLRLAERDATGSGAGGGGEEDRGAAPTGGPVLAEQILQPPAGGGATPVQLIHRPERPGEYRYVLTASPAEGERDTANNALRHTLQVRDQTIKVLLASGAPTYEFRYLKQLLERDSTVELASFLQEADEQYASADPSAVSRLPLRRRELDAYDAVVLIDLDPSLAPRTFWPALRWLVGERGGGLALVAGPRYLPAAYGGLSDFAALYPAELSGPGVGSATVGRGFLLKPTPLGFRSSAMQLADTADQTERAWRRLPPLYWWTRLGGLKPAAQVLATHPFATLGEGADQRPAPLIVSQFYGAGRVVLHGVDSTYRWRRQTGDVYFARYWVQLLRSLARGRLAEGGDGARLTVDRKRYEPGEAVRLRLRVATPAGGGTAAGVAVLLQPESGPQRRVALAPAAEQGGVYEATLDRLPVGAYRVLPADAASGGGGVAARFEVVAPPGEFAELAVDTPAMRAAAQRSRGRYTPLQDIDRLIDSLPAARRVPIESLPPVELWNRWWMLAGVCGCLTCEWVLRKRRAML